MNYDEIPLSAITVRPRIAAIIQARFDSTRLPGKALKLLGGVPLLAWTMRAIRQVPADCYILATDADGFERFSDLATECGFTCIAGAKEDVLSRFCDVIRTTGASVILRATGDNPFLFYDAASYTLEHFAEKKADYYTLTGLPHGSGIEIFSASALLESVSCTDDPYDHEHVGPALYRHPDYFVSVFEEAPAEWLHKDLRTTVDTEADYCTAQNRLLFLGNRQYTNVSSFMTAVPPTSEEIIAACKPIVFFPCVRTGLGTGHLRRCISVATKISNSFVCIPESTDGSDLVSTWNELISVLPPQRIIREIPASESCSMTVLDGFRTDPSLMNHIRSAAAVLAIDEGGDSRGDADFLLDVIPSIASLKPNLTDPGFIPLPLKRHIHQPIEFASILVSFGGEDAAGLTVQAVSALTAAVPAASVTVIVSSGMQLVKERCSMNTAVTVIDAVPDLKEMLCDYDLVITHYGFTAFEAAAAGCAILLAAPTPYHAVLSEAYGFVCILPEQLTASHVKNLLCNPKKLFHDSESSVQKNLSDFIKSCAKSVNAGCRCPVCHSYRGKVLARTQDGTFRICADCGIVYRETFGSDISDYQKSYFFESYARQYGKTYLEDFDTIREQGLRRIAEIRRMIQSGLNTAPSVLDVGCAYGPFLSAARSAGFLPFGIDIPSDAINYVATVLHIPALCGVFPQENAAKLIPGGKYNAVTMWWVIEHLPDLAKSLTTVNTLLVSGGVFAFSTPSLSGISGQSDTQAFLAKSPVDHYTVWDPETAESILQRFGFSIVKVISTGHHPERFPRKSYLTPTSHSHVSFARRLEYGMLLRKSRRRFLGDSFEVYAVKVRDI